MFVDLSRDGDQYMKSEVLLRTADDQFASQRQPMRTADGTHRMDEIRCHLPWAGNPSTASAVHSFGPHPLYNEVEMRVSSQKK